MLRFVSGSSPLASAMRSLDGLRHGLSARLRRVRLEVEGPAWIASVVVHSLLLCGLALAGYHARHDPAGREFTGSVDNLLDPVASDTTFQDLDQRPDPPSVVPAAGSFSPNLSTTLSPGSVSPPNIQTSVDSPNAPAPPIALANLDVRRATESVLPKAALLNQSISIKGNGAEHVGGVEGAVDRLAIEIIRRLEQGPTLVAWAFDASGSLSVERERLAKHIEAVYTHIEQLDRNHLTEDKGLMTLVVSFGQDRKALTPHPTGDLSEILEAIRSVPLDTTGTEMTFTAVAEIVKKWGRYKDADGHPYRTMVVVVTDEVGDDENRLEAAVEAATKAKVPVYVLGSQAVFGRLHGYMDYTDPKTKQVFRNVEVRQGPESVVPEQIRLPFWYDGPQYDLIESGFGPYALSRLASATGGIYFVARFGSRRLGFDPAKMRAYNPDWVSRAKYEDSVARSPLRQAVLNAALATQQKLPGMPSLYFPPIAAPEFKDSLAANQALAERTAYTVEEALAPLDAVAKLRDRETSRRWQAQYDLARGRLLAMKVRCYEYNWICARMKKDPPKFENPRSNAWRLVAEEPSGYSEKVADAAQEARKLLRRVVDEHPDTPWALLAARDLKDPLGFKWVESYIPPRKQGDDDPPAKRKREMTPPRPRTPPRL